MGIALMRPLGVDGGVIEWPRRLEPVPRVAAERAYMAIVTVLTSV